MYGLTLIHQVAFLVFGVPVFWRYMLLLMRMTLCSASHPSPVCWLPCESLESSILGASQCTAPTSGNGPSSTRSFSALSVCGKSSVLVDTGYLHSRRASVSGQPQFSRPHFSATLITATLERIGSGCSTFGLLACLLLRRTGTLWMPIGLHMAFDWGETYFYGVANSGQTLRGHLLNSSSSGPAWLCDGTVGPEGSLLCTMLIVVVWLICAGWLREAKYPKPAPVQNGLRADTSTYHR